MWGPDCGRRNYGRSSLTVEEGSSPGAAGDALRTALEAAAAETPAATSSRDEGDVGEDDVAKGVLHAVAAPHGLSLSARASAFHWSNPPLPEGIAKGSRGTADSLLAHDGPVRGNCSAPLIIRLAASPSCKLDVSAVAEVAASSFLCNDVRASGIQPSGCCAQEYGCTRATCWRAALAERMRLRNGWIATTGRPTSVTTPCCGSGTGRHSQDGRRSSRTPRRARRARRRTVRTLPTSFSPREPSLHRPRLRLIQEIF